MVRADGRKFRFWLFQLAKNGLFFIKKNQVSQALYLRVFLETFDDKIIILRLDEEQPNS